MQPRTHVLKTRFTLALGSSTRLHALVLAYRVTGAGEVEIDRILVDGADDTAPWLRCHVEADAGLIAGMLAHAADDLAWDARQVAAIEMGRAA